MRKILKNFLIYFLSVAIVFISFSNCKNIYVSAAPYTEGIMFGQYYRLRSADANLYLTMNSTSDVDNVGCSLQARSSNNSKQIFMLGMNSSSNTYTLSPMSSSSRKVLSLANNSNSNGVAIVLKSNTGASIQGWNIDLTTQGYFIKSYFNGKTISTKSHGTTRGSTISSYDYSTFCSDWQFEPAYEGRSLYFVTTTLSTKNNDTVNRIKGKISSSGYSGERIDLPVTGNILVAVPESRMTVFHGHGSEGRLELNQSNGEKKYLYSQKPTNGDMSFSFSTRRSSYIMFISCKSASKSSTRESMVTAASNQGARCVTGYVNNVAGGEDYLEKMMIYIQKFPDMTLYYAMKNADAEYTADQRKQENCPANVNNRYTVGNPNFSINMN